MLRPREPGGSLKTLGTYMWVPKLKLCPEDDPPPVICGLVSCGKTRHTGSTSHRKGQRLGSDRIAEIECRPCRRYQGGHAGGRSDRGCSGVIEICTEVGLRLSIYSTQHHRAPLPLPLAPCSPLPCSDRRQYSRRCDRLQLHRRAARLPGQV